MRSTTPKVQKTSLVGLVFIAINTFICKMVRMEFEWDDDKNSANIAKHGLSFYEAQDVFFDTTRIILLDADRSTKEKRYFCIGKTNNSDIATVRFTIRNGRIRIFGAGYWRKGKKLYEQQR